MIFTKVWKITQINYLVFLEAGLLVTFEVRRNLSVQNTLATKIIVGANDDESQDWRAETQRRSRMKNINHSNKKTPWLIC